MGVRVVVDGAVGFAATVDVRPDEAANLVRSAIDTARVTARAGGGRVELAPEPSHGEVNWTSAFEIDPGTVPLADKVARARGVEPAPARRDSGVAHVTAEVLSVGEETYPGRPERDPGHAAPGPRAPPLEALALSEAGFETMRTLAPPVGRGWEYLTGGAGGPGQAAGTGTPSWPGCPSCWPRNWPPRRSRRASTTWSSTPPICG